MDFLVRTRGWQVMEQGLGCFLNSVARLWATGFPREPCLIPSRGVRDSLASRTGLSLAGGLCVFLHLFVWKLHR